MVDKTAKEMVKKILEECPETRESDSVLYAEFLRRYGEKVGKNLATYPAGPLLLKLSDFGVPTIESVGRYRRKFQQTYPDLRATEKIEASRCKREKEFKKWARS